MVSALGSVEFAALALVVGVTWLPLSYWVSRDAAARGSSAPTLWGVAAVVVGLVLPYYLLVYRPAHDRMSPPTTGERFAATVVAASLAGMLAGAFLAPPDPSTQVIWWVGAFVLLLPVSYLLVYRRGYRRFPVVGSA